MIQPFLVKDVFEVYGYFFIDDKTQHGFLIDPGAEADKILKIINANGWIIEKILLTHGHFDHIGAVEKLSQMLKIPYLIHRNGNKYLTDIRYNLSLYCDRNIVLNHAQYFDDGEKIKLDVNQDFYLEAIYTPGHTVDSTVFFNIDNDVAFVGDTIFKGSIGSTQYPGGSIKELRESIINRIFRLPKSTILYSGHSEPTTVGDEIRRYLR